MPCVDDAAWIVGRDFTSERCGILLQCAVEDGVRSCCVGGGSAMLAARWGTVRRGLDQLPVVRRMTTDATHGLAFSPRRTR